MWNFPNSCLKEIASAWTFPHSSRGMGEGLPRAPGKPNNEIGRATGSPGSLDDFVEQSLPDPSVPIPERDKKLEPLAVFRGLCISAAHPLP